jgi:hypothetical protein
MDSTEPDHVSRDPDVGYKRPPKHSRWQPGQSGNPKPKRYRLLAKADVIIDSLFAKRLQSCEERQTSDRDGIRSHLDPALCEGNGGPPPGDEGALQIHGARRSAGGRQTDLVAILWRLRARRRRMWRSQDRRKRPMKPYSVGYGRPPRHTQFKKGVSPNPRGRRSPSKATGRPASCAFSLRRSRGRQAKDRESARSRDS